MTCDVTAIVPCHNAERWIEGALRSILAQSVECREIVIIDDSSTDGTLARIERLTSERCGRVDVRILKAGCRNAAMTRNLGIEVARGKWIALLDADDLWHPEHLERAMKLLDNSSETVALMANHRWIGLDDQLFEIPKAYRCNYSSSLSAGDRQEFCRLMIGGYHFCHSSVVYRTDVVKSLGGFDVAQVRRHDIDLWLRMLTRGTWAYDIEESASYRINTPGSISRNELECDAYYLRALRKNRAEYPYVEYEQYLSSQARRAMGIAVTAGDRRHLQVIQELAWDSLPARLRLAYSVGLKAPSILDMLLKIKRRIQY